MVYLPRFTSIHVGKSASPMDPMGSVNQTSLKTNWLVGFQGVLGL